MSSGRLACDSESCCERRASAVLKHSRGSGPRGALCVHKRAQKRSSARCAVAAVSPLRRGARAPTRALGQRAALRAICCSWFCPGHSTPAVAARAPGVASSERKERKVLPSVTKRRAYDLS